MTDNRNRGKVAKPTVTKITPAPVRGAGIGTTGDGPLCPIDPTHGRTYRLPHGRFYCPHSAHFGNSASADITQHFFTGDQDKLVH